MTNLTLTQKYKLFQRLTGWSRDRIRANDKAVKDLLSGSGGGGDSTDVSEFAKQVFTYINEVANKEGQGIDITKVIWPDCYSYQLGKSDVGIVDSSVQFTALMNYLTPLYNEIPTFPEGSVYIMNYGDSMFFTNPNETYFAEEKIIDEVKYYYVSDSAPR